MTSPTSNNQGKMLGSSDVRPISRASLKSAKSEAVKVCVRCRPMTEKEIAGGHERVVEMDPAKGIVLLQPIKSQISSTTHRTPSNGESAKQFTFDAVYDCNSKQTEIYDETVRPLVDSVLEGFNGTVFAYGQTGTGKTYTMVGVRDDPSRQGIIPNAFEHIFSHIARSSNQQYLVQSSYLEIYQEQVRDLLCKDQSKRLELKERADIGVYVKDLSSFVCKSIKEIEHVMTVGNENRAVGATNMNEHSSRSHAIFIITIEHSTCVGPDNETHIRVGKLNLVDLAGSERQFKTGVVGQRQKEAIKINLSLSALGNVISALVDGKSSHIPYRDSKLTRLLQDSLGGNSKTVMVANIGPASYNYEETLITLRYASRAKNIKNRPRVNEDPKDALLREFQMEIERLKVLLQERRRKASGKVVEISSITRGNAIDDSASNNSGVDEAAVEKLAAEIKAMESRLLTGGKNIIDHTNQQKRELELKRQEIAEQKRREREMLQRLEEQEDSTLEIRETFTSMQQEVELKKRKLRKLFAKLQSVKSEIEDTNEANSRERRELEELQSDLMKELKLKYLIIENFIPLDDKNVFLSRVAYDEEDEEWKYKRLTKVESLITTKRPVSKPNYLRPMTEYARLASSLGSWLPYKADNVLKVDLIMPNRLTKEYSTINTQQSMNSALESVLKEDEVILIDASNFQPKADLFRSRTRHKSDSSKQLTRPKTSSRYPRTAMGHPQALRPDTAGYINQWREAGQLSGDDY
uniref:Kinesin-like protein n=1 Tax=Tetranychus evansi TaxID=178897 RepID=A0A3G5API6_9ACAR|nr:kinesin KIF3B isoform X2 [Tetranychus evansi]